MADVNTDQIEQCESVLAGGLPMASDEAGRYLCLEGPGGDEPAILVAYDDQNRIPFWSAYYLDSSRINEINDLSLPRPGSFTCYAEDPSLPIRQVRDSDYTGPGEIWNRGHLAPAESMLWSEPSGDASFYTLNIAPQAASFNKGPWACMEGIVRSWASNGPTFIISGTIVGNATQGAIGPDSDITIPDYFYTLVYQPDRQQAVAVVGANTPKARSGHSMMKSVDQLEALAGIDFLSDLPNGLEKRIEKAVPSNANWPLNGSCGDPTASLGMSVTNG